MYLVPYLVLLIEIWKFGAVEMLSDIILYYFNAYPIGYYNIGTIISSVQQDNSLQ